MDRRVKKRIKLELKRRLLQVGNPRLQMACILCFTGLSGFTASALLSFFGVNQMAIRYPLAVTISYGAFLLSLNVWIKYILSTDGYRDDVEEIFHEVRNRALRIVAGDFSNPDSELNSIIVDEAKRRDLDFSVSDFFGDLDDSLIIFIIILLLLSLVAISLYFVIIAPSFFAELLVDAIALSGFYKKIKKIQAADWLSGAIKSTWYYFVIIIALFAIGGYLIQSINPKVVTIGDVFKDN